MGRSISIKAKLIQEVSNYLRIHKIQTTPYKSKCDGLTERFNKTLCKILAVYADATQSNWDLYLPLVLFAYRTSQQSTTHSLPFKLLYGREGRLPSGLDMFDKYESSKFMDDFHNGWIEARRQIALQAEINKNNYDSKYQSKPPKYEAGNEVRVKQPQTKLGLKKKVRKDLWSAPCKITKVLNDQNVVLDNKKVVNVNNIKKKELPKEIIRTTATTTRYGRVSKTLYKT
jgi:hypothetical protein